jgi:hypothetical protein
MRRPLVLLALTLASLGWLGAAPDPAVTPAAASPEPAVSATSAPGVLAYRGFTVDAAVIEHDAGARAAVEHQLDVVADCGVRADVLAFFRAQRILVRPGARDHFSRAGGIEIDVRLPPQQPIVLHELLHAYHAFVLPQGARNADVLGFYAEARNGGVYPAGSYVLRNPMEFFAVTASLYLSGHVDRPPFDRETLRARQPRYYAWLGQLFGVEK